MSTFTPPPHTHVHTHTHARPHLHHFFSPALHVHACLLGCHRSEIGRGETATGNLVGRRKKKGGGVKSGTESSEWGIKINLGVTIAAMITARNFHLKANAARPPRTAASAVCPHQYFTAILTFSSFVGVTARPGFRVAFTSPKL